MVKALRGTPMTLDDYIIYGCSKGNAAHGRWSAEYAILLFKIAGQQAGKVAGLLRLHVQEGFHA
jgi:hypothetical protein